MVSSVALAKEDFPHSRFRATDGRALQYFSLGTDRGRFGVKDGVLRSFSEGGLSTFAVPSYGWHGLRSRGERGQCLMSVFPFQFGSHVLNQNPCSTPMSSKAS